MGRLWSGNCETKGQPEVISVIIYRPHIAVWELYVCSLPKVTIKFAWRIQPTYSTTTSKQRNVTYDPTNGVLPGTQIPPQRTRK